MEEEGLKETTHEKIFVGKTTFTDLEVLESKLQDLKVNIKQMKNEDVVNKLKEIVTTFKEPEEVNKVSNET